MVGGGRVQVIDLGEVCSGIDTLAAFQMPRNLPKCSMLMIAYHPDHDHDLPPGEWSQEVAPPPLNPTSWTIHLGP